VKPDKNSAGSIRAQIHNVNREQAGLLRLSILPVGSANRWLELAFDFGRGLYNKFPNEATFFWRIFLEQGGCVARRVRDFKRAR
jgi:hypothetical protein